MKNEARLAVCAAGSGDCWGMMFKRYLMAIGLVLAGSQAAFAQPSVTEAPMDRVAAALLRGHRRDGAGACFLNSARTAARRWFWPARASICEYASKDGNTHIDVLLSTLVTTKPSLAALAYYAKVKVNLRKCRGGPGSCYCSDVGGTDEFGGVKSLGRGLGVEHGQHERARCLRLPGLVSNRCLWLVLPCLWRDPRAEPEGPAAVSRPELSK